MEGEREKPGNGEKEMTVKDFLESLSETEREMMAEFLYSRTPRRFNRAGVQFLQIHICPCQNFRFRLRLRKPNAKIVKFMFTKPVKSFFGKSDRSRKLSYNARACAHPSVATAISGLCRPNAL